MLFHSAEFLFIFFPLCLLLHFFLKGNASKMLVLTLLSAWFYIAAYPLYIFLLLGLIAVDYSGALLMERLKGTYRKLCFALCIFSNVGLLASFKYWNFIAENLNLAGASLPQHDWILPVGLSFHTFQSLSYLIEVHHKSWPPERNLLRYSLYILFFPQMVAGPIERPQNILPQFLNFPKFNKADFRDGLFLLAKGLFMKVAVADRLAVFSDPIFNAPAQASAPQVMLAMAFFMLQIYADFSGYSNMALGTARMLGIKLMLNFRQPYLATSLADFWRRWHISLSTWFRDYIYIPLGGNRNGIYRAGVNLMIVFLLSGLWHGAGWNFIIWGALHGLGILAENYISAFRNPNFKTLNWLRTQLWVMGCWVFFRTISFADAMEVFQSLSHWTKPPLNIAFTSEEIVYSMALFLVIPVSERFRWQDKAFEKMPWVFTSILLAAAYLLGNFKSTSFLYFQF
jgi:D-alanyl-lipoteichoic acid acyltransferase DltB (MBOAT superfamily)